MIKIIYQADSGKFMKLTEAQPEMIEELDLSTLDPAFAVALQSAVIDAMVTLKTADLQKQVETAQAVTPLSTEPITP